MQVPKLQPQPPREWRASVSLVASILGAIAFTIFSAGLVYIMWQGGWPVETAPERIKILGKALLLSLSGSLVVLITLGFAINRRTVKVGPNGFEASGGDDDTAAVVTTTTTTAVVPSGVEVAVDAPVRD